MNEERPDLILGALIMVSVLTAFCLIALVMWTVLEYIP